MVGLRAQTFQRDVFKCVQAFFQPVFIEHAFPLLCIDRFQIRVLITFPERFPISDADHCKSTNADDLNLG